MSSKAGKIYELPDKRLAIVYNNQSLLFKNKIVLNLIGNDFLPLLDEKGKERILIKDEIVYKEMIEKSKLIGFID